MPTHNIEKQWSLGNEQKTDRYALSADGEVNGEFPIPDSSTDLEINISIDISQLKSLYMVSDQDITIETNNATTSDDTLNLKAGKPVDWEPESVFANPFSLDVTKFFATNASGQAATLIVKTLQDFTP